jgi:methyl-accepting chemotaxis protein
MERFERFLDKLSQILSGRPSSVREEGIPVSSAVESREIFREKLEDRLLAVTHRLNGIQMKLSKGVRSASPQKWDEELLERVRQTREAFEKSGKDLDAILENLSESLLSWNILKLKDPLDACVESCPPALLQLAGMVEKLRESQEETVETASSLSSSASGYLAAMEREGQGLNLMAESIRDAVAIVKEMVDSVEAGSIAVGHNAKGMENIRLSVTGATEIVRKMGNRSTEIVGMAKVIRDVAERTNLLALNAGIIAAQAGEHGKSFAVVAEEIKALAERTTFSAKEITQMVGRIQKETADAIKAMETGVKRVEEGGDLTRQVGESLEKISSLARLVRNNVDQVNFSVDVQSDFQRRACEMISKIGEGIQQLGTSMEKQKLMIQEADGLIEGLMKKMGEAKTAVSGELEAVETGTEGMRGQILDFRNAIRLMDKDLELFDRLKSAAETAASNVERNIPGLDGLAGELKSLSDQVKLLEKLLAEQGSMEGRNAIDTPSLP